MAGLRPRGGCEPPLEEGLLIPAFYSDDITSQYFEDWGLSPYATICVDGTVDTSPAGMNYSFDEESAANSLVIAVLIANVGEPDAYNKAEKAFKSVINQRFIGSEWEKYLPRQTES